MGLSRFLNKRVIFGEGIAKGGDSDAPAVLFEGGKVVAVGALNAEGDITGTGVIANTLKFKTSVALTNMWQFVASVDFGAIGIHGSINARIAADVAASGVAVGDQAIATPVGSCDLGLVFGCCVSSAANVQLRASYMGSGAIDPGVIPFKITIIK